MRFIAILLQTLDEYRKVIEGTVNANHTVDSRSERNEPASFRVINDTQCISGLPANVCVFKRNTVDEKRRKIYAPIQVSSRFVIGESESALSKGTARYSYKFSKTVPSLTAPWLPAITSTYRACTARWANRNNASYTDPTCVCSLGTRKRRFPPKPSQLLVTQLLRSRRSFVKTFSPKNEHAQAHESIKNFD